MTLLLFRLGNLTYKKKVEGDKIYGISYSCVKMSAKSTNKKRFNCKTVSLAILNKQDKLAMYYDSVFSFALNTFHSFVTDIHVSSSIPYYSMFEVILVHKFLPVKISNVYGSKFMAIINM